MAQTSVLAALLLLSVCGGALGFANPQAVLSTLTSQSTITQLTQETNPYGLFPITTTMGNLQAGNFLATNWNDAQGHPGQGHTILQVDAVGQSTPFATIDPKSPIVTRSCGSQGVGLTMALVILSRGYVVVGSTPVPVNHTQAGPGCLLVLSTNGTLLDAHPANETTSSHTMTGGGPWAMAVQEFNNGAEANLFVSYVLGDNPASTSTLRGVHGGMVVRYGLQIIGGPNGNPNFWGYQGPDVIAAGFPTQPGNILNGVVGPTGLVVGSTVPGSPYNAALSGYPLFIANNLNSSVEVVPQAPGCFTLPGSSSPCSMQPVAWSGLINGTIGIAQSPLGTIVGANGGIGTLFEVAPTPGANTQLADQLVDSSNNPGAGAFVGAGNLFNVMFHPNVTGVLFFNDDGTNTYNRLVGAFTPSSSSSSSSSSSTSGNRRARKLL